MSAVCSLLSAAGTRKWVSKNKKGRDAPFAVLDNIIPAQIA